MLLYTYIDGFIFYIYSFISLFIRSARIEEQGETGVFNHVTLHFHCLASNLIVISIIILLHEAYLALVYPAPLSLW